MNKDWQCKRCDASNLDSTKYCLNCAAPKPAVRQPKRKPDCVNPHCTLCKPYYGYANRRA